MSFRWPNKDPDEVLDYSVDWSRYLGSASIASITWYVDDEDGTKTQIESTDVVNGIQHVSATTSGQVATINLGLGTNNVDYKFYCQMQDSTGSTTERVIRLRVKEQ